MVARHCHRVVRVAILTFHFAMVVFPGGIYPMLLNLKITLFFTDMAQFLKANSIHRNLLGYSAA
jgi:hypothetical protein